MPLLPPFIKPALIFALSALAAGTLPAQIPQSPAWLRYAIPPDPPRYHDMPHAVVQLGDAPEERTAADELDRGLGHMVAGTDHLLHHFDRTYDSIVLGTSDALHRVRPRILVDPNAAPLPEDGYRVRHVHSGARQWWVLEGGSPRAELYAAFRFAALVAEDRQLPESLSETAQIPLRALDVHGPIAAPETLARLMASVGLNALIADSTDPEDLAAALRPWGIRVWFRNAAPEAIGTIPNAGGVVTSDPTQAESAARILRKQNRSVLLQGAADSTDSGILSLTEALSAQLPLAGLASARFADRRTQNFVATFQLLPGQDRAVVFPAGIWQSALATALQSQHSDTTLAGILAHRGGIAATVTAAELDNMLASPLLQANLFAFGRVAFNPGEPAGQIAEAWARQTFGDDARVYGTASSILLNSTDAYIRVTSPFGLAWLGDGARPDPARSAARLQLPQPLASLSGIGGANAADRGAYSTATAVNEAWLLALNRLQPTHTLPSGKTLIQTFYDGHFAGASTLSNALDAWEEIKPLVDPERFAIVHTQLSDAARHGEVWRDTTTEWVQRSTGVLDELHFVGNHPARIEAESMTLRTYTAAFASEPEDASAGAYVTCPAVSCTATTVFHGEANVYRIETGYYDQSTSGSSLELSVNGVPQARWPVETYSAAESPTSATAERFIVNGVRLRPGDRVSLTGAAALDFVEITRDPRWN